MESFLQSLGQAKIEEISNSLAYRELGSKKAFKILFDCLPWHFLSGRRSPAFSSWWWQLRIIFNLITDSSVNLTKFKMKVNNWIELIIMFCIPEQLFNSAHTAESKGLFMWPGLFTYVHWLSACACFIYFSFISQHTVSVFYLISSIPCIKILIKDNTVIVFIWSSLPSLYVHDSHYAEKSSKHFKNLWAFWWNFPEQAVLFSFLAFK